MNDSDPELVPEPDVVELMPGPLANVDIALLRDMGAPPAAIRSDRTLDRDLLVDEGWTFDATGSMSPPPTPEFWQRAQKSG